MGPIYFPEESCSRGGGRIAWAGGNEATKEVHSAEVSSLGSSFGNMSRVSVWKRRTGQWATCMDATTKSDPLLRVTMVTPSFETHPEGCLRGYDQSPNRT